MELYEYASLDAVGLRALIRAREVSTSEVEDAARRALTLVNPDLNGLTLPVFDPALGYDPDGPLAGVPFLVKDSSPFARGVAFTLGSRSIRGAVALVDHPLMTRFRAAGLATLGQTTAPELGLSFSTESVRYGPTRNPWALGRGAGGSSGGSAALVAAGAVPLAHGNDGAGSLRIPASCCGIVGLKPGRGRTPQVYPVDAGFGVAVEFALSRSIRDTAHLLDAVVTREPVDRDSAGAPTPTYAEGMGTDPGRLRIAVTTAAWSGVAVDAQVAVATVTVGHLLEWIGHSVVEASPSVDPEAVVEGEMLGVFAAGTALLRAPRRPDRSLLEAVSRRVLSETETLTAEDLATSVDAQRRVTHTIDAFFSRYDVLVTPTLGQLPAPHGTLDYDNPEHTMRSWLRRLFEYGPFTAPFNVSGHPAISLPLGQSREGLPIGVQLVAGAGREDLLLQVAAQLEQAAPWKQRQPPIFADEDH